MKSKERSMVLSLYSWKKLHTNNINVYNDIIYYSFYQKRRRKM